MRKALMVSLVFTLGALCTAARADVYARLTEDGKVELRSAPAEGFELYMKSPQEPAPGPSADPVKASLETLFPFARQVEAAAAAANVQPELLHAVIRVESNHEPAARSPAGAVGLMQLMPGTARRYNVKNRLDPQQNLHGGARYLRDLLDLYKNNLALVLAAYNAGEHAVARYGNRIPPFSETRAYVPKVLALYEKLSGGAGKAPAADDAQHDLRASLPQGRVRRVFAPGRESAAPAR
jgi:soluble lytic murein transglycosylase-like protein